MTKAEARFNNSLRPRKPEGSLGQTAQNGHVDSHTTPELCVLASASRADITVMADWEFKKEKKRKSLKKKFLFLPCLRSHRHSLCSGPTCQPTVKLTLTEFSLLALIFVNRCVDSAWC